MSAGATALAIVAIMAMFVLIAAFARLNDQQHRADEQRHTRLLEELDNLPPHKEWNDE